MWGGREPADHTAAVTAPESLRPETAAEGPAHDAGQLSADRPLIHFRSLSDALLFTLAIAGPTSMWESLWRGRPMIDQPGDLWIVPTVIVTVTILIGGAIAGRLSGRSLGALVQGLALAIPVAVVLVLVDLARRLVIGNPPYLAIYELWIVALVAAIGLAITGALIGRWTHRRRRRSASSTVESTLSRYAQGGA